MATEKKSRKQAILDTYVPVKDRIKEFREKYGTKFGLVSQIIHHDGDSCTIIAKVIDNDLNCIVATGHGHEKKSDNPDVNITSLVENCETSAWGRALANLGMAIDKSIASREEMNKVRKPPAYDGGAEHQRILGMVLRSLAITDAEIGKNIHVGLKENSIPVDQNEMIAYISQNFLD